MARWNEQPTKEQGVVQLVIPLENAALATSGDYRNYKMKDGATLSHHRSKNLTPNCTQYGIDINHRTHGDGSRCLGDSPQCHGRRRGITTC